mgnify:CR=1 FL=1
MYAAEDRLWGGDIALDECDVMLTRHAVDISVCLEGAILGRKLGHRDLSDKLLGLATIGDEVGDGDDDEVMLPGKIM